MTTGADFRAGMARVGGAVHIVTTDGPAGRAGFTATAVTSVSDSPPTLLVCQNRASAANAVFKANRVLCVNTLAAPQHKLAEIFAGMTGADMPGRFAAATWTPLASGAPALTDALVSFDCRIREVHEVGTHSVLICGVVAVALGETRPGLAWFARAWYRLDSPLGA